MKPQPYTFVKKEFVRGLDHDTRTISGIDFTTTGTPVFHIFQDGECVGNNLVALIAFDICDKADATGIPLKRRMV